MLIQLHHQHPDGRCEFVSQTELFDNRTPNGETEAEWFEGVRERHPLPEGCEWIVLQERHPQFMMGPPDPPRPKVKNEFA